MTTEQEITREALRLGFVAVGFAAAGPSDTAQTFSEWLESGRSAGLAYLKKHAAIRADVRELMPDAKTIIIVAARYPANNEPGSGFSSYSWGRDYHEVLREKLTALAEFMKGRSWISASRVCVDSAPVSEREWALRAGIGWRGRQGQIVNAENGCCLVLGEILVDTVLKPSAPAADQCGSCRKCVDACPTGALCADGLVDARRCISYLTIEHKGEFTAEQEGRLGESLFGCDICTAVCLWNKAGEDRVLRELIGEKPPTPEDCMKMTAAGFKARFKDTVVFRTGLKRLKRNAGAVFENMRRK
jgi:epoxyqueuosine reductase